MIFFHDNVAFNLVLILCSLELFLVGVDIMTTKHEHEVHHKAAVDHRKAAHHFEAAAKHQILAAVADDNDDEVVAAHHAYLAYGHQIQAIRFAEWAAIEDESVDHSDVDHE